MILKFYNNIYNLLVNLTNLTGLYMKRNTRQDWVKILSLFVTLREIKLSKTKVGIKRLCVMVLNKQKRIQFNKVEESGLVGLGIVIRIGRFPVQTPLGTRPGLGTQPRYEAPGDLRVEYVQTRSD